MRSVSTEFLFNMTAIMWQPIVFGTTPLGRVTFPRATSGQIEGPRPGHFSATALGTICRARPSRFCLVLLAPRADVRVGRGGVSIAKPLLSREPRPDRGGQGILRRARALFGMAGIIHDT